jgi:hypothetical protein
MRAWGRIAGRLAGVAWLLLLPAAAAGLGDAEEAVAEIRTCIESNIPRTSSEQIIEFTKVDRVGGKRVSRAKILGKRFADGLRRIALRFSKPPDLRGACLLVMETTRPTNDMFLYTPELRKVKRVTAEGAGGSLFGTDFSYEDFERWQLLNKPGQHVRRENSAMNGRPVYVLETQPAAESGSSYEVVVSYVDQKTCVVLRSESFEPGKRLRKVFTVDPESIIEEGEVHVATEVNMQDVRDETHTSVTVEDVSIDREIPDREFTLSRLSRCR